MSEEWRFLLKLISALMLWAWVYWIVTGAKLPGEKK